MMEFTKECHKKRAEGKTACSPELDVIEKIPAENWKKIFEYVTEGDSYTPTLFDQASNCAKGVYETRAKNNNNETSETDNSTQENSNNDMTLSG